MMELLGKTQHEYREYVRALGELRKSNEVAAYTKAYCLLVFSQRLGYTAVAEELREVLLEIFEARKGRGLFLAGEMMAHFESRLQLQEIDSEKEYFRALLNREIKPASAFPKVEKQVFRELEPKIREAHVRPERRSKERPQRRQVRREREAARQLGQAQARRKREEDREYGSYLKAAERKIKRQN